MLNLKVHWVRQLIMLHYEIVLLRPLTNSNYQYTLFFILILNYIGRGQRRGMNNMGECR